MEKEEIKEAVKEAMSENMIMRTEASVETDCLGYLSEMLRTAAGGWISTHPQLLALKRKMIALIVEEMEAFK